MLTPEEIAAIKRNWVDDLDDSREMRELCDLALRGLNAGDQWRTMESAPKDGTSVMLWNEDYARPITGEYFEATKWSNGWKHTYATQPTHWQPLPTPPAMKEKL